MHLLFCASLFYLVISEKAAHRAGSCSGGVPHRIGKYGRVSCPVCIDLLPVLSPTKKKGLKRNLKKNLLKAMRFHSVWLTQGSGSVKFRVFAKCLIQKMNKSEHTIYCTSWLIRCCFNYKFKSKIKLHQWCTLMTACDKNEKILIKKMVLPCSRSFSNPPF